MGFVVPTEVQRVAGLRYTEAIHLPAGAAAMASHSVVRTLGSEHLNLPFTSFTH